MKTRLIWLMTILSCIVLIAYASEKDAGMSITELKQGWNWYNEPKDEPKPDVAEQAAQGQGQQVQVYKAPEPIQQPMTPEEATVTKKEDKKNDDQDYNHSVNDFRFPLTDEAKKIPVLANFLQNPNEDTAREWMKWQARYFEQTSKIGWSLRFAYLNHGDTDYRLPGYASTPVGAAISSRNTVAAYQATFAQARDKVALFFFYKKGCEFCEAEISPLRIFAQRYHMQIYGVVANKQDVEPTLPFKTYVSPNLFYRYSVTSVPTLGALYGEKQQFQVIANGYTATDNIELNLRAFMYNIGLIDQSKFLQLWRAQDTVVLTTMLQKAQKTVAEQKYKNSMSTPGVAGMAAGNFTLSGGGIQ